MEKIFYVLESRQWLRKPRQINCACMHCRKMRNLKAVMHLPWVTLGVQLGVR